MNWIVVYGSRAQEIEARSPQEAVLEAARYLSVWDNIVGATLRVYPAADTVEVLVQYERPNVEGEPIVAGRMPDNGRPRVVSEFVITRERSGLFSTASRKT